MKFDEKTLLEIENYITALAENVGLKPDTILDIDIAINKQRKKLKSLTIPIVSKVECNETPVNCVLCGKPLIENEKDGESNCCDECWLRNL